MLGMPAQVKISKRIKSCAQLERRMIEYSEKIRAYNYLKQLLTDEMKKHHDDYYIVSTIYSMISTIETHVSFIRKALDHYLRAYDQYCREPK